MKTKTSNELGGLLMKLVLFISLKLLFLKKNQKKPDMYLPLLEKFLKIFIHESKY